MAFVFQVVSGFKRDGEGGTNSKKEMQFPRMGRACGYLSMHFPMNLASREAMNVLFCKAVTLKKLGSSVSV